LEAKEAPGRVLLPENAGKPGLLCALTDDFAASFAFPGDGQNLRNKSKFLSAIPIGLPAAVFSDFPGFFPVILI
jgi:hypothetical protein